MATHWASLYVQNNNVIQFDSFGVEYIPKEIKAFLNNKDITTNILEYKHMIQKCVDIFAQDLLILRQQEKL